jgi:mono/diheme cytochrome c family protein
MTRLVLAALIGLVLVGCAPTESAPEEFGSDVQAGNQVYSSRCAVCHGGNGEGGSGPDLADVLETFGECTDQIEWITLGSNRYQEEVGPTYGDAEKEITAVMPGFAESLTEVEIAQVAAFERHRFGEADENEALTDCGL